MKLRISVGLFLAATFTLALWDVRFSHGQGANIPATPPATATPSTAAPPSSPPATVAPAQPTEPSKDVHYFYSTIEDAANAPRSGNKLVAVKSKPGGRHVEQTLRQAAAALRDAQDDVAKADAQTQLTSLLNNYFEEDMRRREEELAKIEARLKDLREQAARRREKKSEIVDLQIKVLLNEVEGLGFFSEAMSTSSPLVPVEKAFQRRVWVDTPTDYRPAEPTGAAPAAGGEATTQPLGVPPSPR